MQNHSLSTVKEALQQMLRTSGRQEISLIDTATEMPFIATTEQTKIFGSSFAAINAKIINASLRSGEPFRSGIYSYQIAKKLRPGFRKMLKTASLAQTPDPLWVWSITIQGGSLTHCLLGSNIDEVIDLVPSVVSPNVKIEKSSFRKTRDRGRKVGAAAKDKVRLHGCLIGLELLQSLEAAGVAHENVTKETVLEKPTLDALREKQVPPAVALMIIHAYRFLAKKPRDDAGCRSYFVAIVPDLFDAFESCDTVSEVRNTIYTSLFKDRNRSLATFGKGFVALGLAPTNRSSAYVQTLRKIEHTSDANEAWQLAHASLVREPIVVGSDSKPLPSRIIKKLSELKRKGPATRSLKLDLLSEKFGFTGIEVGEWVNQQESELLLRLVAEAFFDLKRILGPWIVALNRQGNLALALGARGKGRACAHFEPMRSVINLSKQKGDGSLAHEWAHFLDFQLAKYGGGKEPFLSERIEKQANPVHPIGKAMAELMTVMKTEEAAEKVTGNMTPQRWYLKRWVERLAGGNVTDAQLAYDLISEQDTRSFVSGRNARANSINLVDSIARMTKSPVKVRIRYLKDRAYFAEAKGLGKYWSSSVELFARAFESFIEDQLHRRSCMSEFLVYGTRRDFSSFSGNPYPTAVQRKQINHAIANLINAIVDNG